MRTLRKSPLAVLTLSRRRGNGVRWKFVIGDLGSCFGFGLCFLGVLGSVLGNASRMVCDARRWNFCIFFTRLDFERAILARHSRVVILNCTRVLVQRRISPPFAC